MGNAQNIEMNRWDSITEIGSGLCWARASACSRSGGARKKGADFMADGYARISGRSSACLGIANEV